MDKIYDLIFKFLDTNSVIIMVIIFGIVETIKQYFKYIKKNLLDWQIRIISIIIGVIISILFLEGQSLKYKIIYGIFYSFSAPVIYWLVKKYIIKNISSNLNNTLSGQN